MKKLIFAVIMVLALALASYGKANDKNTELVNSLTTAWKNSQTSFTTVKGDFARTTFDFSGKKVIAYHDAQSDELIGFAIPVSEDDLPAGALTDIRKKYSDYAIKEMIFFIYENGSYGFYASLTHPNKPTLIAGVSAKGKAYYFTTM